jgi:hypothetical protein
METGVLEMRGPVLLEPKPSPLRTTTTSPGSTRTPARRSHSSSSRGVTGLPTVT